MENGKKILLQSCIASKSKFVFALLRRNPGFISGGKLKIEPLGCYSPAEGLQIPKRESTVVRRRNMDGLRLKIMTVVTQKPHQPFELYLTTPQNTHLDSVHRYNYGLMGMLKEFYNFT